MDVITAIRGRASTRAFLDKPVGREIVESILEAARWAPSGVNTQPWQVAVAKGEIKDRISRAIVNAVESGEAPRPDYQYYPGRFTGVYRERQVACGKALYGALEIVREDMERRKGQWMKNYYGFGAPVELFVMVESALEKGSWVDMGMFIQNIMLAARGFGLETCPQAAMAEYPDIVRNILGYPESLHLICGIAIGHADHEHRVNSYRTEREPVESFTQWFGSE